MDELGVDFNGPSHVGESESEEEEEEGFRHPEEGDPLVNYDGSQKQPTSKKQPTPVYADAIRRKTGVPVDTFGYVDGTTMEHCRPTHGQRACWDGHHRSHDLLFQGIKAPDGLTLQVSGPWEGKHHDAHMTHT